MEIYNTLTRKKVTFSPNRKNKVGLYVCGMTVYDYCHIGHARVLIVFDVVSRYFRHRGYELTYVRNITDIDDKIIKRAAENNESVDSLTRRTIAAMHEDEVMLNVLPPDVEPRATAFIDNIVTMISTLVQKGYAYVGSDGDVFYRVHRFDGYGRLSGKSLHELEVGARVDVNESKEDPLDFVLWKMSKPGEPKWPSPWGDGRPGWHIECSTMSTHCLGNNFDIHAGGRDLQFPHHENEIAQSEAATGETFVNLWMHNGYVTIRDEKMSKSLGNFFTIRDVLKRDDNQQRMGEIIRYMTVASHYRSPVNFSGMALENSRSALARVYMALSKADRKPSASMAPEDLTASAWQTFYRAMDDDFNTPEALAVVFDLVRDLNKSLSVDDGPASARLVFAIRGMGEVLGLFYQEADSFLDSLTQSIAEETRIPALDDDAIDALVSKRRNAKKQRNFAAADRIRDELQGAGIVLEDLAGGETLWRRK